MNNGLIIFLIVLVIVAASLGVYTAVADNPFGKNIPSLAVQVILPNSTDIPSSQSVSEQDTNP